MEGKSCLMGSTAFVVGLQNVQLGRSAFCGNVRAPTRVRRARVAIGVRRARAPGGPVMAQEQGTKEPETDQPEASQEEKRAELSRQLKFDKQRLELMAERARLDAERAQLIADRKRLELDKFKELQSHNEKEPVKASPYPDIQTSYKEDDSGSPPAVKPASVEPPKIGTTEKEKRSASSAPPPFAPQSISDLMGIDFPRVEDKDIDIIKEHVCGMKTFFATEVDRSPFQERVVFRGNLRLEPEEALEKLEALAAEHGLQDRVRLFLLLDPKEGDSDPKKPVLVALPAAAVPNQSSFLSTGLSLLTAAITVGTTLTYGIGIFGFTPAFVDEIAKGNLNEVYNTLPISIGILGLMAAHEIGHRVMGKLRDIKLGLPFPIPSLQIGCFGTITPLESYPRTRRDLFDVAVAGPILGMGCSLAALVAGLGLTGAGSLPEWFPQIPSALFHASILVGGFADLILPAAVRAQATLAVHPLTVIGYTGLLVNALNLLPIGRLDGGRIVQALYGRASASRISAITLILQGLSSIFGNSPLLLFWGLICVFLQRESDYPCQNEIVEPDDGRAVIGLATLFFMLAVLIPFPDQLGDILGRY